MRPVFLRLDWVICLQEKLGNPSGTIDGSPSCAESETEVEWVPCLHSVEGETVYDFAW